MSSVVRTLLLTDVVDSTKLVEQLGDVRAAEVWARHDTLARQLLVPWNGLEIDKTDGFLMLFEQATDAVHYTVAFHRALVGLSSELGLELAARAGLHTGHVVLRENPPDQVARGAKPLEVEGIAKPTAARVMSLAQGRQTLLTPDAREALGQGFGEDAGLGLLSHGHWRLKGVSEPLELFEVGDDSAPFIPPPDTAKVYRVARDGELWTPAREIPNNLAVHRGRLFGREDDLRGLHELLDAGHPIVSVIGPTGVGTTSLVRRYASTWLGDWPGGVWWCDARLVRDAAALAGAIEAVVPKAGQSDTTLAARCLVILDGLTSSPAVGQAIVQWRRRDIVVLVTATRRLGVNGEAVRIVRPFVSDPERGVADPAIALYLEQARGLVPGFEATDAMCARISRVANLVQGLPRDIALASIRAHGSGSARPYRGLGAFRPEDADLFFGRDEPAERLVAQIRERPFVTVTGASGVGKTSLLQAGIRRFLPERELILMRPGSEPLSAFERALTAAGISEQGDDATDYVLVVDQAEELVTLARHDHAASFGRAVRAFQRRGHGRVVFSIRGDFFARLAEVEPLRGLYSRCVEVLVHPDEQALTETLVRPAALFGAVYEEGLAEQMVATVADEPAALALLQFCADQLWDRRDRERQLLTRAAYDSVGGVEGALAEHADRVLSTMSGPQRVEARRLFLRLTTEEMTKEPRSRQDLVESSADPERAIEVLTRLVEARLLTVLEADDGASMVEIVHEALLRHWQQVADWLGEDREGQRMLRSVGYAAREWDSRGRERDLLWRGELLRELRRWRKRTTPRLTPSEDAFVQACESAERARRRRRRAGLVLATLVMAVVTVSTTSLWRRSVRSAEVAELNELIARAQVDVARRNDVRAITRATEAFLREPGYEPARSGLYQSIATRGEAAIHPVSTDFGAAAFSPDGSLVVLFGRTARTLLLDAQGREIAEIDKGNTGRGFIAAGWAPDSQSFFTQAATAPIRVWDRAGQEIMEVPELRSVRLVALDGAGHVALGVPGEPSGLAIYDSSGALIDHEPGAPKHRQELAWSPDGSAIAMGWGAGTRLWSFEDDSLTVLADIEDRCVRRRAWHPAGHRIALSGPTCEGIQIHSRAGERLTTLDVGGAGIRTVRWSPDGRSLVAVTVAGAVLLRHDDAWSEEVGRVPTCSVTSVLWSPDSARFLADCKTGPPWIWTAAGQPVAKLDGHLQALNGAGWAADGQSLTTFGRDGTFRVWDARGRVPTMSGLLASVATCAWQPTGERVAAAAGKGTLGVWSREGETLAGPPPDYAIISGWRPNREMLGSWSPDGQRLVTWRADREGVRLRDADGQEVATILGPEITSYVTPVARWIPDSNRLLVASKSFSGIYDDAGTLIAPVPDNPWPAAAAAWDPRGELFASIRRGGEVGLWTHDGSQILSIPGPEDAGDGVGGRLTWHPDGTRFGVTLRTFEGRPLGPTQLLDRAGAVLGTADGELLLWHPDGGRAVYRSADMRSALIRDADGVELARLESEGDLRQVKVGREADLIATTHRDGTAILWRWDGSRHSVLGGSDNVVNAVCFDPRGELVFTGTGDGSVRIWPLSDEGLLAEARRLVPSIAP